MIDLGINLFQEIAALGGGGGYPITNSLRFNDNDSAYLSRTPSVAGNRKTWTWSGWVKLGNLSIYRTLLAARLQTSNEDSFQIHLLPDDKISIGGYDYGANSDLLLRDPSGWYHIVVAFDTTQATSANRIKAYINGTQITLAGSFPPLNLNGAINNTQRHDLGFRPTNNDRPFDGYMAEVNFIDGQALTPDDFGQIDATTGEWSPKAYAGTYGTNGFYLPFDGNANDDSGNGNNWTENNLASTDYMIDTPTNNFSVLNGIDAGLSSHLYEANLFMAAPVASTWYTSISTIQLTRKTYFEVTAGSAGSPPYIAVGITKNPLGATYAGSNSTSYSYLSDGTKYNNGSGSSYGATYTTGDIIGVAFDADTGELEFFKNNVSQGIAFTVPVDKYYAAFSNFNHNLLVNFGQDSSFAGNKTGQGNTDVNGKGDFYYQPPFGYLALCTDNLPAPAIEQPETQFNVVTYSGNSSSQDITGVGFNPDFVWIKRRTNTASNSLTDVVRGDHKGLFTDSTLAEITNASVYPSLITDGFNIPGASATLNQSGDSYVAWCWKAGGTAVSNTDGSITSQVSANVEAGFSIVGYTGTGAVATLGHGLDEAPEMVIVKDRGSSGDWIVWGNKVCASNEIIVLNGNGAAFNPGGNYHNDTYPSSSVITLGDTANVNASAGTYICYAFHSVEGFSKFGSYVGNGSADGPFIYTGFKPSLIMYKRAIGGTGNWTLADNERKGYNGANQYLYPNLSNVESISGDSIDLLANGFKILNPNTGHNASGDTYIYMAFAEHPFKEALAR